MTERSEGVADAVVVAAKRPNLLAELKRRNVIRMAGLYLVGAWLLIQIAETLLPAFDVPGWVLRAVIILLALGFIPAVIVSWLFELTPDGLKRDDEIDPARSIAPRTGQRMDRLLLAGLVLVVVVIAADRWWPRVAEAPVEVVASPANVAPVVPTSDTAPAAPIARGIAVLPFGNLSPDPDNAFFAGGIHEEVLTRLSRINALRVISRTSMETIATEKLEVPEIGRRLGVSHVMEGSVRRAGDQVRITVQLIEAATDKHLWAENYDRKLDDVFAIQSEIALAIADQLQIVLTAGQQSSLAERPTQSAEAYDLYLRAIEQRRVWRGAAGFKAQIALLEPAIKLDPDFVEAWSMLADAHGRMAWLDEDADGGHERRARTIKADLESRWPAHFETRRAQADFEYNVNKDLEAALIRYQALLAERPNHADIAGSLAACLKRLRRPEAFLEAATVALQLDPESPVTAFEKVRALGTLGRTAEALALADRVAQRMPDDPTIAAQAAEHWLQYGGDRSRILALRDSEFDIESSRPEAMFSEGDVDGAARIMEASIARAGGLAAAILRLRQAMILRLADRDAEGLPIARRALLDAEAWAAVRELKPDDMTVLAAIAALANEPVTARAWIERVRALEDGASESKGSIGYFFIRSISLRWLGDVDGAWQLAAPEARVGGDLPDGLLLGLRPYYDAVYGKSAAYRAHMAALEAKR